MKYSSLSKISSYIQYQVEKEIINSGLAIKMAQSVDSKKIQEMQRELINLSAAVKNNKKYSSMAAALSMAPHGADGSYGPITKKALATAKQIADDIFSPEESKPDISLNVDLNSIEQNIKSIKSIIFSLNSSSMSQEEIAKAPEHDRKRLTFKMGQDALEKGDYSTALLAFSTLLNMEKSNTNPSYSESTKQYNIDAYTYYIGVVLANRNQGKDKETAQQIFNSLLNSGMADTAREGLAWLENRSKDTALV